MNYKELHPEDRAFLEEVAGLNGLDIPAAFNRLLHPHRIEREGCRAHSWNGAVVEDNRFRELYFGTGPKFPDDDMPEGFPELHSIPSIEGLRGLRVFSIHRIAALTVEVLDLRQFSDLKELRLHGQPLLSSLKTGGALRRLSLLGSSALRELDISRSTALESLNFSENKALGGGVVCSDIQALHLRELKSSRTLVAKSQMTAAGTEELEGLLGQSRKLWADKAVLKAVSSHENLSLSQALRLYWQAAPRLFGGYAALKDCDNSIDREGFRALRLLEKRVKEERLLSMAPSQAPGRESVDRSLLKREIPDLMISLAGITPLGEYDMPSPKKKPGARLVKNDDWALNEMGSWLSHPLEYGRAPVDMQVYYRKRIPWFGSPEEKIFLVSYSMDSGESFIGFTGPDTWSFTNIPRQEIQGMNRKTHKLDLINLYAGACLAHRLSKENPSCRRPCGKREREALGLLDREGWEDLHFEDYIRIGDKEHFVFEARKGEKEYHVHLKFEEGVHRPIGNRSMEKSAPVDGRVPLSFWLGVYYGPIRWGA